MPRVIKLNVNRLEGNNPMNRKSLIVLISFMLLFAFSCQKDSDVPVPVEPPEVPKIEKPAEEVKPTPPPKPEVEKPKPLPKFDVNDHPLQDVYFEFDKFDLTPESRAALQRYSEVLKTNSDVQILVEGHCDERGTEEYNIGLGEKRAQAVHDYLVNLGVSASRLKTISYGESRPKVDGHDEEAWAQNRRAHFLLSR